MISNQFLLRTDGHRNTINPSVRSDNFDRNLNLLTNNSLRSTVRRPRLGNALGCLPMRPRTCKNFVTLIGIGKRSGICGRKASDPTPAPVTAGRVAGLHLVSTSTQVPLSVFALSIGMTIFKGMGFSNEFKFFLA